MICSTICVADTIAVEELFAGMLSRETRLPSMVPIDEVEIWRDDDDDDEVIEADAVRDDWQSSLMVPGVDGPPVTTLAAFFVKGLLLERRAIVRRRRFGDWCDW